MKSARETLSAAELRQALQFVRQYCVPDVGERFISHALEGLFHLFPCLVASYGELDPITHTGRVVNHPMDFGTPETNHQALSIGFDELDAVFQPYRGHAVRLSTIMARAKFRGTRFFQEIFAPVRGLDLLVLSQQRKDGLHDFFSVFRQGFFSDRDEALLEAVSAPLESALTNARALAYLHSHRSMLESGLRNSGWNSLITNPEGRILVETREARRILSFHFQEPRSPDILPPRLRGWLAAFSRAFEVLTSAAPDEPAPFSVVTSGKAAGHQDAASSLGMPAAAARRRSKIRAGLDATKATGTELARGSGVELRRDGQDRTRNLDHSQC